MERGDDTPLNLGARQNGNGLRTQTTRESHSFSRVECQERYLEHFHKNDPGKTPLSKKEFYRRTIDEKYEKNQGYALALVLFYI